MEPTPSEQGSESMEGHSEVEEKREEYFGEQAALPVRRSPRLGQTEGIRDDSAQRQQRQSNQEDRILPYHSIEAIWIKLKDGRPMRVWVVRLGNATIGYGADGSRMEMTRQELARQEVPYAYVQRH